MNFGNGDTEFPVPNSTARVHGMLKVKRKKKFDKLIIAEIGEKIIVTIVAMALPKIGRKKKFVRT